MYSSFFFYLRICSYEYANNVFLPIGNTNLGNPHFSRFSSMHSIESAVRHVERFSGVGIKEAIF